MSGWDILLIAVVSFQTLVLAYMSSPGGKALLVSLPLPFTVAVMSVGLKVGPTHMLGMVSLFLYFQAVRVLFHYLRLPIVAAIACSLVGYCLIGWGLTRVMPDTPEVFWWTAVGVSILAVILFLAMPYRHETTRPTPLPIWKKLPVVMIVIGSLIMIKGFLMGFATMFPMVSVVAAYEARSCLWTLGRQIPVFMLAMAPMMVAVFLIQDHLGVGSALMVSWVAYIVVFGPLTWLRRREEIRAIRLHSADI